MSKALDLTGKTFHRITLSHRHPESTPAGKAVWIGTCACGTPVKVVGSDVVNGHIRSCGCWNLDQLRARGNPLRAQFPAEYIVWKDMRRRCLKRTDPAFKNYGARGICVDHRWTSFTTFITDMKPRPSREYTLERRNNALGYSAENCFWATRPEQSRNSRRTQLITFNNETLCLKDWANRLHIKNTTLWHRVKRWPIERALMTPVRKMSKRSIS